MFCQSMLFDQPERTLRGGLGPAKRVGLVAWEGQDDFGSPSVRSAATVPP